MKNNVLKTITEYGLFNNSKKVTVALSGGADSVSLLYVLLELKEELSLEVFAAHLNHKLRGAESERDEQFVKQLCASLGVTLFCESADVSAESEKTGESIELAARRVRYQFLERVAAGGLVATAHTASDSAETVLYNLTRGTALKGLCGIPVKRDIFVRPLINVSRAEVEEYCKTKAIAYVTDSTNNEDLYTRNKLRHGVVPVLRDINPAFERSVARMAKHLLADNDYLVTAANELYSRCHTEKGLLVEELLHSHTALATRVVLRYLEQNGVEAYSQHVEQIMSILPEGKTVICGKTSLIAKNGLLFIEKSQEPAQFLVEKEVVSREEFEKMQKINSLLLKNALDYDRLIGEPLLRTRESGDKIRLSGRGVTKTLKKLYLECSLPKEIRDTVPVLADEAGVAWVYSAGVAERVAVTEKTEKILLIKTNVSGGY